VRNNSKDRKNTSFKKHLINEQISATEVRLITESGENIGIVSRADALSRAEAVGMDLVKIGEQDGIVIAKIMDFGKFLYLKKKQQSESKKNQKVIQIKEIKMRPNIDDQDYKTKFNRAVKFLSEGKRVKFTLQFRGREMAMKNELGNKFFERIANDLEEKKLGSLVAEKEQRSGPFWSRVYYIKGA
jgi:translation initiation factor IF-3